jgi:TP901 family phage tail tape measure protein
MSSFINLQIQIDPKSIATINSQIQTLENKSKPLTIKIELDPNSISMLNAQLQSIEKNLAKLKLGFDNKNLDSTFNNIKQSFNQISNQAKTTGQTFSNMFDFKDNFSYLMIAFKNIQTFYTSLLKDSASMNKESERYKQTQQQIINLERERKSLLSALNDLVDREEDAATKEYMTLQLLTAKGKEKIDDRRVYNANLKESQKILDQTVKETQKITFENALKGAKETFNYLLKWENALKSSQLKGNFDAQQIASKNILQLQEQYNNQLKVAEGLIANNAQKKEIEAQKTREMELAADKEINSIKETSAAKKQLNAEAEKANASRENALKKLELMASKYKDILVNGKLVTDETTRLSDALRNTNAQGLDPLIQDVKDLDHAIKLTVQDQKLIDFKQIETQKLDKIEQDFKDIINQTPTLRAELTRLRTELDTMGSTANMQKLKNDVAAFRTQVQQSVPAVSDLKQRFLSIAGGLGIWTSMTQAVRGTIMMVRSGINIIREFDDAMANVRITTDFTNDQIKELTNAIFDQATALSANAAQVAEIAKTYANATSSVDNLKSQMQAATVLMNIAGLSARDATNAIQGISQQFQIDDSSPDALMGIADSLASVSAQLKYDFGDGIQSIFSAVQKGGSIAREAGYDINEFAATIGTVVEKTRLTGETVGTAFRTIAARLGRVKDEVEGTVENVSNAEKAFRSIGIELRDGADNFRELPEVLGELALKWDTLTDVERNYVAEQAAGVRQISIFTTWMDNYAQTVDIAAVATNDHGAALEANSKIVESIGGKVNQLKTRWQEFWNTASNSSLVTGIIEFLTKLLETMNDLDIGLNEIIITVGILTIAFKAGLSSAIGTLAANMIATITGTQALAAAQVAATATTTTLTATTAALQAVLTFGISLAITGAIAGLTLLVKQYINVEEEQKKVLDNAKKLNAANKESQKTLKGYVDELSKVEKGSTEHRDLMNKIAEAYPEVKSGIDDFGDSVVSLTRLEELLNEERQKGLELQRQEDQAYKDSIDRIQKKIDKTEQSLDQNKKGYEAYKDYMEGKGSFDTTYSYDALYTYSTFDESEQDYNQYLKSIDAMTNLRKQLSEYRSEYTVLNKDLSDSTLDIIENVKKLSFESESTYYRIIGLFNDIPSIAEKIVSGEDVEKSTKELDKIIWEIEKLTDYKIDLDVSDFVKSQETIAENSESMAKRVVGAYEEMKAGTKESVDAMIDGLNDKQSDLKTIEDALTKIAEGKGLEESDVLNIAEIDSKFLEISRLGSKAQKNFLKESYTLTKVAYEELKNLAIIRQKDEIAALTEKYDIDLEFAKNTDEAKALLQAGAKKATLDIYGETLEQLSGTSAFFGTLTNANKEYENQIKVINSTLEELGIKGDITFDGLLQNTDEADISVLNLAESTKKIVNLLEVGNGLSLAVFEDGDVALGVLDETGNLLDQNINKQQTINNEQKTQTQNINETKSAQETLNEVMGTTSAKVDSVNNKISETKSNQEILNEVMGTTASKVDNVNSKVSETKSNANTLNNDLQYTENKMGLVKAKNDGVIKDVNVLSGKIEGVKTQAEASSQKVGEASQKAVDAKTNVQGAKTEAEGLKGSISNVSGLIDGLRNVLNTIGTVIQTQVVVSQLKDMASATDNVVKKFALLRKASSELDTVNNKIISVISSLATLGARLTIISGQFKSLANESGTFSSKAASSARTATSLIKGYYDSMVGSLRAKYNDDVENFRYAQNAKVSIAGATVNSINSRIAGINSIKIPTTTVNSSISDVVGKLKGFANGGIVNEPTFALIGEQASSNPEVVLNNKQIQELAATGLKKVLDDAKSTSSKTSSTTSKSTSSSTSSSSKTSSSSSSSSKTSSSTAASKSAEIEFDRYKKLNEQLEIYSDRLKKVNELKDSRTTEQNLKLLEEEIFLYQKQRNITNEIANAQRNELAVVQAQLKKIGFNVVNGEIENYLKLQTLINNANKTGSDASKQQVDNAEKLIDKFYGLKNSIRDLEAQWWNFNNTISQLQFDSLVYYTELVNENLQEQFELLDYNIKLLDDDQYARKIEYLIDQQQNRIVARDELQASLFEIRDKLNKGLLPSSNENIKKIKEMEKQIRSLNLEIKNFGDTIEKEYNSVFEDLLKDIEEDVKNQSDLIKSLLDDINKVYKERKDILDEEIDAYKEAVNLQLELIKGKKEESNYDKETQKLYQDKQDLIQKINKISLDTSFTAKKERADLEEDLAKLNDTISERDANKRISDIEESLKNEVTLIEQSAEDELKNMMMTVEYNNETLTMKYDDMVKFLENEDKITTEYYESLTKKFGIFSDIRELIAQGEYSNLNELFNELSLNVTEVSNKIGNDLTANIINKIKEMRALLSSAIDYKTTNNFIDVANIINEMKKNSAEWNSTTNQARRDELAKRNLELGASIGATRGSDGVWMGVDGKPLYSTGTDLTNQLKIVDYVEQMQRNSEQWWSADPTTRSNLNSLNTSLGSELGATRDSAGVWWLNGMKLYDVAAKIASNISNIGNSLLSSGISSGLNNQNFNNTNNLSMVNNFNVSATSGGLSQKDLSQASDYIFNQMQYLLQK